MRTDGFMPLPATAGREFPKPKLVIPGGVLPSRGRPHGLRAALAAKSQGGPGVAE
jgi:hypothetical protein